MFKKAANTTDSLMTKLQNEMYLGGTYVETRVGLSFVTIFG